MAVKKFLDINGFKHFVEKVIGKTDISTIGDGTVKGAIWDINQSLADIRKWKVLVNSVPSTTVTEWNLPTTDWKELEIRIGYSNDNNYCALRVVKAEIPSTGTQFRRGGYYYDSQNRMYVGIGFTKTKIGVSDFNYISGGTSKNAYSTSIYYR